MFQSGYYLVRDLMQDELYGYDIAAWDQECKSWAFVGDSTVYPHNSQRWKVIKFICDPECAELRWLKQ